MLTRTLTVQNDLGSRTRAAAFMAVMVNPFSSCVMVRRERKRANARSIVDLLLLDASPGSVVQVTASGADEELAIETVTELLRGRSVGEGREN